MRVLSSSLVGQVVNIALFLSLLSAAPAFAQVTKVEEQHEAGANPSIDQEAPEKENDEVYMEYFSYEEYVYSRSKKTELGDQVELDSALRYQYSENTFARLRFETDPQENRLDNQTSKFELLTGHQYGSVYFQVDGELQTNEPDSGGMTFGLDLDSEGTLIAYQPFESFTAAFYPFNFDGEVGREFNTWDVTRLYFIEGTPSTINQTPSGDEKIAQKTIPGFVFNWHPEKGSLKGLQLYAGGGVASYLYPSNEDFDIRFNPGADRWERKEDFGYKAGVSYDIQDFEFHAEYVGHSKAEETGSLLKSAASIYSIGRIGDIILEGEVTWSQAGEAPYRISGKDQWFDITNPFNPIYSDLNEDRQDWIGESDLAYAVKLGHEMENMTPYLLYRRQGKHFIFRERESAHLLRTATEDKSHGGLHRMGFGAYFYVNKFTINPEFEYLRAENPVFDNSADIREDKFSSLYKKNDFFFYLTVSYDYGGMQLFKP